MATYTVIQDVEAEDKFLGPLTLKQFIFGAIGVFFSYLGFFAVSQGAAFLLAIFLPPALLGFFLAVPWSSEQPTEVWVLAKLRFKFKNQPRIWDQAGLEELVTINVPKKVEKNLTDGLDQDEVKSRLRALASTIDSRGWAVKNSTLNEGVGSTYPHVGDRLIDPAILPRPVPEIDIASYDDVLDEGTLVSENFNQMILTSANMHKQQTMDRMDRARNGEPDVLPQPAISFTPPANQYDAASNNRGLDEQLLTAQLRNKRSDGDLANSHMKNISATAPPPIQPQQATQFSGQTNVLPAPQQEVKQAQAAMTKPINPDIMGLVHNNDLSIATLARQAKRDQGNDEVVISLR